MQRSEDAPEEIIQYRRSPALTGIELLDVYQSPRNWQLISPGYALCFLQTWRGSVRHRGQSADLEPGIALRAPACHVEASDERRHLIRSEGTR